MTTEEFNKKAGLAFGQADSQSAIAAYEAICTTHDINEDAFCKAFAEAGNSVRQIIMLLGAKCHVDSQTIAKLESACISNMNSVDNLKVRLEEQQLFSITHAFACSADAYTKAFQFVSSVVTRLAIRLRGDDETSENIARYALDDLIDIAGTIDAYRRDQKHLSDTSYNRYSKFKKEHPTPTETETPVQGD